MKQFATYVRSEFEGVIGEIYYYSPTEYYRVVKLFNKINKLIEEIDMNKGSVISSGVISKDLVEYLEFGIDDYSFNVRLRDIAKSYLMELETDREIEKAVNNFDMESLVIVLDIIKYFSLKNISIYRETKLVGESGRKYTFEDIFEK